MGLKGEGCHTKDEYALVDSLVDRAVLGGVRGVRVIEKPQQKGIGHPGLKYDTDRQSLRRPE